MMTTKEIRKQFLDFFESKGHKIVPSAPIVVKNDPTLMFINSGMAPFKDIFLGNSPIKYPRVADTQKCLRVSGKHNDLEEVGIDTYHHTMFEMLGNWSFGDYFKAEAIAWSWELLTEVYKLPKDRLYVTVFEGDEKEKIPAAKIALEEWRKLVAEDHIVYGNKKDNFWEMGETGPCGTCSEIHVDCRSEIERAMVAGRDLVNKDHPQVIEIWNNVFMQYNRLKDGRLEQLPLRHVDTGMGLERLVRVLQNKQSNYDTDIFQPLIQWVAQKSGIAYGVDEKTDIAMRVIADHIRAISFTIADGQLPSNNKAGYVIRRILRRAVRYGFTFLNLKKPFLNQMVPLLATQFDDVFPELKLQQEFVAKVIQEEESAFLRTLEIGLKKLDEVIKSNPAGNKIISGSVAFELYDTFGFPLDLTQLILRENNLDTNLSEFDKEMEAQRNRARNATATDTEDWVELTETDGLKFTGYDKTEDEVKIVKYRKVTSKGKENFQLVFDTTPFYAESGGQIGDTGQIISANEVIDIIDTQKENNQIIHVSNQLPKNLTHTFKAVVNQAKRKAIMANHSATHLIHAALKNVLGTHVNQKGSLVSDEYLRFDISHFQKISDDEIKRIEKEVNQKIRENIALEELREIPVAEAMNMGATALFGEKYGENVRVIIFDRNYSMELCGGTHVKNTGEIGLCKITSESAVAAGVRRIEAITSSAAEAFFNKQLEVLEEMKGLLNNTQDPLKAIADLKAENHLLKKKIEGFELEKVLHLKKQLESGLNPKAELNILIEQVEIPNAESLKNLCSELKKDYSNLVLVLAALIDGKPLINVAVSDALANEKKFSASQLVKELSKEIKGGGGGQAGYASAGGSDVSGLTRALEKAKELLLTKPQ